jgi:DNA polymerase (family X)
VAPEIFGAALHYFTGSKAHNIAIRGSSASSAGLKLNEYGVWKGKKRIAGDTEESVFAAVGLPYIEPELREDQGELEAARRGELPALVERPDLQGDLHSHTTATDGKQHAARDGGGGEAPGVGVPRDHRAFAAVDPGARARPARLAKQIDEIDELNAARRGSRC